MDYLTCISFVLFSFPELLAANQTDKIVSFQVTFIFLGLEFFMISILIG